jgi:hypothetical protein
VGDHRHLLKTLFRLRLNLADQQRVPLMAASDDEMVARFQQLGFGEQVIREALHNFEDCKNQAEEAGCWLMENHVPDGALAIQQPPALEGPAEAVLLPPEPPFASPHVVMGVPMPAAAPPGLPAAAANHVEAAPAEVQPPPILQTDEEATLYFQELGFDEENIRTALLLIDGDAELLVYARMTWLLAQLEDDNEERAEALPGPSTAAPQGPTTPAVDRRKLAGKAEVRQLLEKKERREKEEARVRAIKAQEQEVIDRKRARARAKAELNQANADAAEDAARAGRGAHAEAAEVRAVRAGPSGLQPGPSCAEDPALRIAAARAAAMQAPVDSLAPAAAPPAAAPPAPAAAAATAAARRAAEAEEAEAKAKAEVEARKRAEPSGAHLTAVAPAAQAPLDAHAKRERKLIMLLQQEGLAPDEAATVAASCKVLETETLVLEASSDGREMRALLVASACIAVPPPAAPSAFARPVQSGAAVSSAPPPPAAAAPAPVSEPAPETLRDIQDKEYAAALAADQEAEVRAATNEAATAASSAVVAEALAGTGPADEERPAEEPDSPVPLSAQELRARRLAVLETGEPRSG